MAAFLKNVITVVWADGETWRDCHSLSGECLQAPPAKRGSGQVSLKDLDKLHKVTKHLKDLETQTALNTDTARTFSDSESSVENTGSDSSDDDRKQ